MKSVKFKAYGWSIFLFVLLSFVAAGCNFCCGKKAQESSPVIAKINNYKLTADDFSDEARLIVPNMHLSANADKAKEDILGEIIVKKVLLQEAQKRNFDKDKDFMKEIERYWEQALLKLLMKSKIDEFSKRMSPEIKGDIRRKMLQAELAGWVEGLRKTASVKINEENLKKVEIK